MLCEKLIMNLNDHWSDIEEVGGSRWHFRVMLWIACHLPLFLIEICTAVVCFFFWLGACPVRVRSGIYLKHLQNVSGKRIGFLGSYCHIFSFGLALMEKLLGWKGAIKLKQIETQDDDLHLLVEQLNQGKGAFILCSHLGNMEMLRSLTGYKLCHAKRNFQVYPVMNLTVAKKFYTLLRELNPDMMKYVIDADTIGVDTAIKMKEKIAQGNLVVIAGDRTSANSRNRVIETSFLGEMAAFPEGAFLLAGILYAPVYFVFAVRKHDFNIRSPYEMHVIRAKTSMDCSHNERSQRMKMLLQEYTTILEELCKIHPYQWYNFFNFWEK